MKVNLNSIEKVKNFVADMTRLDDEIDLVSGRYVVDAKSLMGIFSLDLTKPIEVVIARSFNQEAANRVLQRYV